MNNFVLGDDTGLGKTLECIAALSRLWTQDPEQKVIIVTTKSSSSQWIDEFGKFTEGVSTFLASSKGGPEKRKKIYDNFLKTTGPTVLVINYALAKMDYKLMQDWAGFILILDECSAIKSTSTQTHQVCKYLALNSKRIWGVSATIIKNNLLEGYGIYKVVLPSLFGSKKEFVRDYCVTKLQRISGNRKIPIIVGYRKKDIEKFKEMIDPYFLGRPKHEVAEELPVLTCKLVKCEMSNAQKRMYDEALSGTMFLGGEETEVSKLTAIIYCQQIANHPALINQGGDGDDLFSDLMGIEKTDSTGKSGKFDELFDILREGDLSEEKVIIFSRFKKMVNLIQERIKEEFKSEPDYCVRVTGDEDDEERKRSRDLFQDMESKTRIICITMAGGEAINLQSAKAIIFYDTPWSAGDYLQILGRMIRIGSSYQGVYAIHLISDDSVDQHVMNVLSKKMELVEGVLGKRLMSSNDVMSGDSGTGDLYSLLRSESGKRKK